MTFAHGLLLGGGVLVLLVIYGLIRRAGRRGYRLRDLTDLSSGVDPDWERYRRTMGRPDVPRQDARDADGTGRPPEEERSS
jgi:hypothetical protein